MATSSLLSVISVLDSFKLVAGKNPPLQLLQCFLYIASSPEKGTKQEVLQDVTGLSESSCSRMVQWLGATKTDGSPGLALIRTQPDPTFWKRNILTLTPKGEQLANIIESNLNA